MTLGKLCCICGNATEILCAKFYDNQFYCKKHYQQIIRHGAISKRTRFDPNEFIIYENYAEIVLYDKKGNEKDRAIIDLEDLEKCKLYKWFKKVNKTNNYVFTKINKKPMRLHRYILNYYEKDFEPDHIDGNGLNNKKENLRLITHQQNMMNQRILPSNNTSGYIGVTRNKSNECWDAQIKINGKHIYLGSYINIEDAILARKNAEIKYFGIYKSVNFE